uniref:super-infection exclusion protein B n=1 Tax=Carnobacterium sp. PL12RED10 TaxID=2592351 RepID=UPI002570649A|nr:super-infection exclusion protein B [Carnobacterium sp. PL12RED10]
MNFNLNITDILNLPIKIMSALALASGLLLFLPSKILAKLYLDTFINKYGFIIGLIFIVSLAILIITLIIQVFNFIANKRSINRFYQTAETRLRKLSPYEICIVLNLFEKENYTNLLPINDGAVKKIESEMIIGKATTQYMISNLNTAKFPYLLHPWVVDELKKKDHLLDYFESTAEEFLKNDANKQLIYDSCIRQPDYY